MTKCFTPTKIVLMTILSAQVNELSLHDLRNQFRGSLPQRNADRMSNLGSKVPLELADSVADFAFLGKTTSNKNAGNFLSQLGQLSGTKDDGRITEFKTELIEVKFNESERPRQAIFLNPVKPSLAPKDQFEVQSPVIIWDSGSEISVARPSLINQGKYLITTIHKELNVAENAEEQLIAFINLKDENNLSTRTRIVSEKEYASTVINSVKEKTKSF